MERISFFLLFPHVGKSQDVFRTRIPSLRGPLWWPCFLFHYPLVSPGGTISPQMVKNLPAMQETWVWSLGQEDPFEEGMATHSRILAKKTPWTEEPGRLQSVGSRRVGHDWAQWTRAGLWKPRQSVHSLAMGLWKWLSMKTPPNRGLMTGCTG